MYKPYLIIVILFFTIVILIGMISSQKVKNDEDWLIARHSLETLPSIGTYFASIVSSVSIISYVGYCYFNGWGGIWVFSGTFLTSILAVFFYAARLRKVGEVSLPDYLEVRFCKTESIMASVLIFISSVFMLCAQVAAGTLVLKIITGWETLPCIVILCVVLIVLTSAGGMVSVAWTDTFCALVMFLGVWIMAFGMLRKIGGFSSMQQALYNIDSGYMDPMGIGIPMILSWIFTWGVGNYGVPHFVTRFFAVKDEKTAKRSQMWCLLLFLLFDIPLLLIGLAGIIAKPGIQVQDEVTGILIRDFLHPVTGGVIFAAILAGCISTADSILLLASTTVSNDIYKKIINKNASFRQILFVSRISTWMIGVLAIITTFLNTDAILWIQVRMVTIMGAAMAPSVMIGTAWKRANATGGMLSFVAGLATAVAWYILDQPFDLMPMLPAFGAGTFFMVAGSLIGEKNGEK